MPIRVDNVGAGGGSGITTADADLRYLKLNQSTAQSITGGLPIFLEGMAIGNATSYITMSGDTWYLYVNSALRHQWTTVPAPATNAGIPIGILAAITYPD